MIKNYLKIAGRNLLQNKGLSFINIFGLSVGMAFAMLNWLQKYDYRIDISWWVFAIAGLLAFVIALLTVSTQAIKAAIANPVKSLRTE